MTQMRTHLLEGRNREEQVGELGNMARHKQGLTNWRGGTGWWAGKCGMTQMRTHLLEGRRREERVGELGNMACHK